LFKYYTLWRDSSVVIVAILWNGYLRVRGSLPESKKGFLCLVIVARLWNGYLGVRGSLPESKKVFLYLVHHIHTGA
jgi:hypothetical protein